VRLLSAYGPQLQHAYLEELNEDQLRYLVDACKNAMFQLDLGFAYPSAATLNILGPQLDRINMGGAILNEDSVGEVNEGWNKCTNLRHLDVKACNVRTMTDVMAVPKKQLKHLAVGMGRRENKDDVKKIMDIAAVGTEDVEVFEFDGPEPSDDDSFDNFIRKNKDTLESICIPGEKLNRAKLSELQEVRLKNRIPSRWLKDLSERGVCARGVFYTL